MERVEGGSEGLLPPAFALFMRVSECGGGMEAYFRVISYNEGIDERNVVIFRNLSVPTIEWAELSIIRTALR